MASSSSSSSALAPIPVVAPVVQKSAQERMYDRGFLDTVTREVIADALNEFPETLQVGDLPSVILWFMNASRTAYKDKRGSYEANSSVIAMLRVFLNILWGDSIPDAWTTLTSTDLLMALITTFDKMDNGTLKISGEVTTASGGCFAWCGKS